ncbi:regulator of microtubule dynamics protein 1 [Hemicordylus capensis]|uniref:regulator of microtubule dynamics protein 1 n=1 Tax=Hemicordylus capensis TaxID=884348 RepID=UPI002304027F|nr:regulator of microtubule dynamics protein 1 [Hemicordylus capensis]
MAAVNGLVAAARHLCRGAYWAGTRLLWEAPKMRCGWQRRAFSRQGGSGGRSEVLGKSGIFRRGLAFSALSVLGYEAYTLISQSAVVHANVQVDEVLDQADYLYGSGETEKLYQLLNQHKNSENAELLWRLARALRDVAQLSHTSAEKKKELTYEALDYAKKALEKDPSIFAVHKWYAICISDVGDYEGIKTKIANAYVIKEHFQKAIELNPKDATSLHLMGIWCFTFAEMPWYQSKIAAVLFSTPPSSTYEEALRYFQKAEDVEPNFYSKNLLFLGKAYMKLNNRKLALLWLTKAKERLAHTEDDKQVQKEAVELLNSL